MLFQDWDTGLLALVSITSEPRDKGGTYCLALDWTASW
jgi:hypothetical protein